RATRLATLGPRAPKTPSPARCPRAHTRVEDPLTMEHRSSTLLYLLKNNHLWPSRSGPVEPSTHRVTRWSNLCPSELRRGVTRSRRRRKSGDLTEAVVG